MQIRRHGSFAGGIVLHEDKHLTLDAPISAPAQPETLMIPLAPCGKSQAKCLVNPGDRITAGEKLAEAPDASAVDIFSPLDGTVVGKDTAMVIDRCRFVRAACLKIEDVSQPQGNGDKDDKCKYDDLADSELLEKLSSGGLTTHGSRIQPLGVWAGRAKENSCHTLILNAMENDPGPTSDHALLSEFSLAVIEGLNIIARAIGANKAILAVDARRTYSYRKIIKPAEKRGVTNAALPHKYPIGDDNMLVKVLTSKDVPIGADSMALSTAVTDVATCFAVYQWVAMQIPATARVVTVTGERIKSPGNYWLPYGFAIDELTNHIGQPLIHGGLMRGIRAVSDSIIGPASNVIVAPRPASSPLPTQCIRCSWCADHCPAGINVPAMNDAYELNDIDLADRSGVQACIGCGVCSYICPARLPLRQRLICLKRDVYRKHQLLRQQMIREMNLSLLLVRNYLADITQDDTHGQ